MGNERPSTEVTPQNSQRAKISTGDGGSPFLEPRSVAVPAASCGGVPPPPARTPGETPGELASEDACPAFAAVHGMAAVPRCARTAPEDPRGLTRNTGTDLIESPEVMSQDKA